MTAHQAARDLKGRVRNPKEGITKNLGSQVAGNRWPSAGGVTCGDAVDLCHPQTTQHEPFCGSPSHGPHLFERVVVERARPGIEVVRIHSACPAHDDKSGPACDKQEKAREESDLHCSSIV